MVWNKHFTTPAWMPDFLSAWKPSLEAPKDRMALAIALAAENVRQGTGGPFGALVYDLRGRQLVSAGVNLVLESNSSLAHGEIVALMLAQEQMQNHDLGALSELELATSAQPCIQCYGALFWSGIKSILIGARGEDVEALVGFDEGPLPADWVVQWEKRGIRTRRDLLRPQACRVLESYRDGGHPVYNPSR